MLKQCLQFLLIFFLPLFVEAQIRFEKGYFISNQGQKVNCYLKNLGWLKNPINFEYKILENDEQVLSQSIENVSEFGVENSVKYKRAVVLVDTSRKFGQYSMIELSSSEMPEWKQERVFLKVLVEGKANLYYYNNSDIFKFFYSIDSFIINQLIHKEYSVDGTSLKENNSFRNQLNTDLSCEKTRKIYLEKLNYSDNRLIDYFESYNSCFDTTKQQKKYTAKKGYWSLKIVPRISFSKISSGFIQYPGIESSALSKTNFYFGIENEFVLPFKQNKWSLLLDLAVENFKVYDGSFYNKPEYNYNFLTVNLGFRHYMFLSSKLAAFVNGTLERKLYNKTNINSSNLQISKQADLLVPSLGIGLNSNKFGLEIRLRTSKDAITTSVTEVNRLNNLNLLFSYTLFSNKLKKVK